MAAANILAVNEPISCLVCFEHYRDPRSLKCFHHFCPHYLEKIVTAKQGQRAITCPTCRAVTPLAPGSQVRDLPKPLVVNELQEIVKKVLIPSSKNTAINCENCDDNFTMATKHCYECHNNMCDRCHEYHRKVPRLAPHKTVPISNFLFCNKHGYIITLFCVTCSMGICNTCYKKEHPKHDTEDIDIVADERRTHISKFIKDLKSDGIGLDMTDRIHRNICQIESQRDTTVGKLDNALVLIKTLENKIKKAKSEIVQKTASDITALKLHTLKLAEMNARQTSLLELGQYLVQKASGPEVVARAIELNSRTSKTCIISPPLVSIPEFNIKLTTFFHLLEMSSMEPLYIMKRVALNVSEQSANISDVIGSGKCPFKSTQLTSANDIDNYKVEHNAVNRLHSDGEEKSLCKSGQSLIFKSKIKVVNDVYALTLNPARSQLIVKTSHNSAPIKVYDLKGNKLTQFGRGIYGLSGDGCMSLDSHRDLYMAACYENLTVITLDGHMKDRIEVKGCNLSGVTYIHDKDLYAVSDITNNKINIIDPRTKSVVKSFGSKGTKHGQFVEPYYMSSYTDQGKPVIVISDCNYHRVQLLDLYGTHLHTYGSYGDGDGQLDHPCGVAIHPTGRVYVCDRDNMRIVFSGWKMDRTNGSV